VLLSLVTRSGNRLLLTKDHKLLDGDTLEWKRADQFNERDLLVAPQRIPEPRRDRIYLWDILPDGCKVSLTGGQKALLRRIIESEFGTLSAAARELELPRIPKYYRHRLQPTLAELRKIVRYLGVEADWRTQTYTYDKCPMPVSTLTPELAYLCGFVKGDAAVKISDRRASMVVTQSPKHQAYIDRFKQYWEQIFSPLSFRRRKSVLRMRGRESVGERIDWSVGRRVFGHIYEHVIKDAFANVIGLPNEVLRGFVAGLTDSDGYVGRKTSHKNGMAYETWNVVFEISADDETNLGFLLALRRFGVIGTYQGVKKGVGIVVISSRSDILRLRNELRGYSVKMLKVPAPRRHDVSGISEKLPSKVVQSLFREAFDGTPTTGFAKERISSTVYDYKNLVRLPSVGQVQKVIERHPGIPEAALRKLGALLRKDYFLDEIMRVDEVPYNGYVYDLVMEGPSNFVANGIVVHNCIDEFEKMKPEDRTALHEMMEQQTCTIAKAGIYATLNARTAILAACNPVLGRYNPFQNLTENIGTLPIPLLSRFDLIFVFRDQPAPAEDERLATHILAVHSKKTYTAPPPIEFSLLKKYLAYTKKISPSLTKEAVARLKDYYLELRRAGGTDESIPPTPRTLEALIRVATARARVLLREEVTEEDALAAVALMNRMVEDVLTDATTKKTDFGIQFGKPVGEAKNLRAAMEIFKSLEGQEKKPVERRAFKEELVKAKFADEDAEKMIRTMFREGMVYESKPGYIRRLGS
jgi:replicative DNA helicase Mcm